MPKLDDQTVEETVEQREKRKRLHEEQMREATRADNPFAGGLDQKKVKSFLEGFSGQKKK